jgi:transposase
MSVLPGQSVTGNFYVQVLQRLRDAVQRKWRDKWQGQWLLHHYNAPSHTSLVVQQFLTEENIGVITQPPYSQDLAPSEFWLSPTLKMGLKGTHFATMEDIKSNAMAELWKIPKEAFHRCFQQWQDHWSKCVCVCACARAMSLFWELFDCPSHIMLSPCSSVSINVEEE